tara:strand:+ start:234 stop:2009 length:1776 start_codon:yes stop_codon:yes gene_type:complete
MPSKATRKPTQKDKGVSGGRVAKTSKRATQRRSEDVISEDFRKFLFLIWKHLNLPPPTPVQYDIATYIQHGPKRSCVQAFRGVGKSWITSAFTLWQLYRNPETKILVVSASKERADAFSTFTLRLISEVPFLKHLKPKEDQRSSKIAFDVGPAKAAHAPSVKSVGITGQLTGSRGDLIIADDVEVPNNSATQQMRDKLSEQVKEFDAVLSPGGRIIYLGTPQTEDSVYQTLADRGYELRVWPALKPSHKEELQYGNTLSRFICDLGIDDGEPTDPDRFDTEDLLERKASYGKAGFSLQFMLNTQLSDVERYPLKVRDLIVMSCDKVMAPMQITWGPDEDRRMDRLTNVAMNGDYMYAPMHIDRENVIEYTGSVMAIDPSGRGQDETGYAVVKMLNGFLFVTACGGLKGGYDDQTLKTLAGIAKDHSVNAVIVESNFGDGMYTKLLTPVLNKTHPVMIEEVKHSSQKEKRIIDTIEPVMARHKLVIDPQVIEDDYSTAQRYDQSARLSKQLIYQMTRVTYERGALRHDDRLDALAMAVGYWVEQMSRDEALGVLDERSKALQAELDDFMDAVNNPMVNRKTNMASKPLIWMN